MRRVFASVWVGVLLAAVSATGALPSYAQETLQLYTRSGGSSAALPSGTTLLTIREPGGQPFTLNARGFSRQDIERRLQEAISASPDLLLDRVEADGRTRDRSYRRRTALYVLARTPSGTLYESQVAGEAGFDLPLSGTLRMDGVPVRVRGIVERHFETVMQRLTTTRLTLQYDDGRVLPRGTEVRVWTRHNRVEDVDEVVQPDLDGPVIATLDGEGRTEDRFPKTWHAGTTLYVLARTPMGTFHESQTGSGGGFDIVRSGWMTMRPVPEARQSAMADVFADGAPGSGFGWKGLAGGLLLLGLGLGLGWWAREPMATQDKTEDAGAKTTTADDRAHAPSQKTSDPAVSQADAEHERLLRRKRAGNTDLQQQIADLKSALQDRKREIADLREDATTASEQAAENASALSDAQQNRIHELEATVQALTERLGAEQAQAPVEQTANTEPDGSATENDTEILARIGAAFLDWCAEGSAMVGRYYMFERHLRDTLSDAQVSRIYYDARTDDRFRFDASDASGEFWIVEQAAGTLLLPVPKRDGTFRALAPAFEAPDENLSHTEVSALVPARLDAVDNGYRLHKPGTLESATTDASDS